MTEHIEGEFTGASGGTIFWQAWVPADTKAVVVLAHGYAEHSSRYAHVGARLAEAGYAVYAPDHRGHGRSEGVVANIERMDHVLDDLHQVRGIAEKAHPTLPTFLLGHSMGGLIVTDYLVTRGESGLSGAVLSGAAVDPTVGTKVERLAAAVLSRVAPNLPIVPFEGGVISRDPAVVAAYEADPLVYNGKVRARTGAEVLASVDRASKGMASLELPLLVLHGGDDQLTAPAGSEALAAAVASPDKTLKVYDGLFHEIFNEPEQDEVLGDVVAWLDAHL